MENNKIAAEERNERRKLSKEHFVRIYNTVEKAKSILTTR